MRKFVVLFAFLALPALASVPVPAKPSKYVTDVANVLDDARESALNEKLAQYERETSNQLLVYVDRKVPRGTSIEEFGAEAIRKWAVGQGEKDNGAILFLFIDDRASRVEVGYGLEGALTDARSKRVLFELRPLLRDGEYMGAVEAATDRIIETIRDPNATPPLEASTVAERESKSKSSPLLWLFLGIGGFGGVFLFGFIKALRATSEGQGTGGSRNFSSSDSFTSSWSSSDSSSSSFSDSSSSSSDSSSSFSGGGGSGGGGGASDNW